MTFAATVGLGAIAGGTIFLGLPVGRARNLSVRAKLALSMLSAGILAFLFMDVGSEGLGIIETRLDAFKEHDASLWPVIGLVRPARRRVPGRGRRDRHGLAAPSRATADADRRRRVDRDDDPGELAEHNLVFGRAALQTGMVIAVAIGLHNFAEGLAIGVSAQAGEIGLATVLVVGFALHNSTEGFGIVGPLGDVRPTWRWLIVAGLVAGGPTFVGAMVGYQVTSDALALCFFALAGGAILYVIGEIWASARRQGHTELGLYMLGVGFLLGIATDLVVAYGGA